MAYTLVTGASGGIGMELAKEFARNGHNLIIAARTSDKLEMLKTDLEKKHNIEVEVFVADLSCEEERNRLYSYTQSHNMEVEILVNNAGFGDSNAFLDAAWERQRNMVELNNLALMHLTYLYGNEMKKRGCGKILNLSSVAAFSAGPYMSIYYASKGFVLSFSEAIHEELKGSGVTVTALCPGPTATGFEKNAEMKNTKTTRKFARKLARKLN
ncbi:MAG: SDR family oxidoreductase [Lachnospiraceae bacterium]|nr:SDR family oxidoreductase [Lachnospiraceae bacterium]